MVGSDRVPSPDDYERALVEVAVRQFRERAREGFLFAVPPGDVASGLGEEASKKQNLQPRNEAPLNFVSLRSSLHDVGLEGLSRVEMNAQRTGALDSPSQPKGRSVLHFSLDTADDFIDGVTSPFHSSSLDRGL
jgi:hypothetical protein